MTRDEITTISICCVFIAIVYVFGELLFLLRFSFFLSPPFTSLFLSVSLLSPHPPSRSSNSNYFHCVLCHIWMPLDLSFGMSRQLRKSYVVYYIMYAGARVPIHYHWIILSIDVHLVVEYAMLCAVLYAERPC